MKRYWYYCIALFLCFSTAQVAFASGFSDKVKDWLLGSAAQASGVGSYTPDLDSSASRCIGCHNDIRASHIVVKNAAAALQYSISGVQENHPVGMNYEYYSSMKAHDYTPPDSLNPDIVLVDGNVTCISCHRLKHTVDSARLDDAPLPDSVSAAAGTNSCSASGKLTVGPRQTDLCRACHTM